MPTYTLAQLRTLQLRSTISARLTSALASAGLPVTDWAPAASGGVELSVVEMVAGGLAQIVAPKLVAAAEGRFLDLAAGDALTAYAKSRYKLDRRLATYTIQNIRLTSSVGDTFAAGDLWVAGAGGNRYVSLEAVTLDANVPQDISFQAEEPGSSYNDPDGSVTKLVTAPAGLTVTNTRPSDFTPTTLLGTSSGRINSDQWAGSWFPPGSHPSFGSIRIRILAPGGEAGYFPYEYSLDGGLTWKPGTPAALYAPITGKDGVPFEALVAFINGTPPSFIVGDIFTMIVGDPILQRGADEESDQALRQRCRDRWSTLSDVPTEGLVRLWAHDASPEVAIVRVDADPNTPGSTLVTIASSTGPASPQAQIAVEDYISARLRGYRGIGRPLDPLVGGSAEERVQCSSAIARAISQSGVVSVPRAQLGAVQQEADRRWQAYLSSVGIGGVVRYTELVQAILDAGAIDVDVATLLLGPPLLSRNTIALAANEVPVVAAGATLASSLTWKPV